MAKTAFVIASDSERRGWFKLLGSIKTLQGAPCPKPVFISYAWDDPVDVCTQLWLRRLLEDLQRAGFDVFLDLSHMDDDMNDKMQTEFKRSITALVICTPLLKERSVLRTNVAFELGVIVDRKKALGAAFRVLPLIYSGDFASSVPDTFKRYLCRDCRDKARFIAQLTGLVNPFGVIPAILGVRKGHVEYETLLSNYHLACLSNLPACNVDFCGREAQLAEIAVGCGGGDMQVINHKLQAIGGLGGVGKSQLALQYYHDHANDYAICRWIMSDGPQLSTSMRLFAEVAGIDLTGLENNEVLVELCRFLSSFRWLLVFDNVDDATAVKPYLPSALKAGQHVLITSRSQAWPMAWSQVIEVDVFKIPEAVAYVNAHINTPDQESVEALATALGCLPLALTQAVAYVQVTGVAVSMYLKLMRSRPISAMCESDERYPHTVKSNWALSMDKIRQNTQASLLLNACAWLAADDIPLYLLVDCCLLDGDELVVFGALKTLRAYSMVQLIRPGYINTHRLVQAVLQEDKRSTVIRALCSVCPWHKQTASDISRTRDLLEHMSAVKAHTRSMRNVTRKSSAWLTPHDRVITIINDAYGSLGDAARQRDLLERALRIEEAHYGPDHYEVAITLTGLGNAYGSLGDAARQRDLLERALRIKEAHYGLDHA